MSTPLPPQPPLSPASPPPGTGPSLSAPAPARTPRSLEAGAGVSWWSEAWRIFTAAPGTWLAITILFVVIMIALNLIPVVGGLASQILGPVFTAGALLGCHALARGEPMTIGHLFDAFKAPYFTPLLILGLIVFGFWLALLIVFFAVMVAVIGVSGFTALMAGDAVQAGSTMLATFGFAALLVLAVGLFAITLFVMFYWFAPPLIAVGGMPVGDALKASLKGSLANIVPFLVYGLIFFGLAIVASIPFGLGWLVLAPVAIASIYSSWRQVFGD